MSRLVENCPFTKKELVYSHCSCCNMTKFAKCCGCDSKPLDLLCNTISERNCVFSPFFNHLCEKCIDCHQFTGNVEKTENSIIPVIYQQASADKDSISVAHDQPSVDIDDDDDGNDSKSISLLQQNPDSPLHHHANEIFGDDDPVFVVTSSDDDDDLFSNNFQQAQPLFDDMLTFDNDSENEAKNERMKESDFIDGLLFASDTDSSVENCT